MNQVNDASREESNLAFLVLSAATPWVYALAKALGNYGPATAVRFYDWNNYRRLKPEWPDNDPRIRRRTFTFPPGYAGKLEPFFRQFIKACIRHEIARLRRQAGVDPIVICPYPYLAPWVRNIAGAQLVYYNLDDYALYDPRKQNRVRTLELELLQRSRLTACLSVHQQKTLRERCPATADRIVHLPLGVVEQFINENAHEPASERAVGYVGNLTNRVDWRLVGEVAKLLPDIPFKFVGSLQKLETGLSSETWEEERQEALHLPNVEHIGPVRQSEVVDHYWRYAVNWMPYDILHPFNIASCPTKIMDALASGRPFISTPIPEVETLRERIYIASNADALAKRIEELIDDTEYDSSAQVAFTRGQTWDIRAREFLIHLGVTDLRSRLPELHE